ncbi:MAG: hypothetical protein HKM04_03650 [Legionellales bacterium]|nr:hypothetical protein [Legionellales bacterium]
MSFILDYNLDIKMKGQYFSFLATMACFIYPLVVYIGFKSISPHYVAVGLCVILLIHFCLANKTLNIKKRQTQLSLMLLAVVLSFLGLQYNDELIIKIYPVIINFLFFGVFFYSLYYPPSLITRLAQRTSKKPLPDAAIIYTEKVTLIWSVFFILNGFIALWTVFFEPEAVWRFYNGFVAYILMGALFLGEFITRFFVKRRITNEA